MSRLAIVAVALLLGCAAKDVEDKTTTTDAAGSTAAPPAPTSATTSDPATTTEAPASVPTTTAGATTEGVSVPVPDAVVAGAAIPARGLGPVLLALLALLGAGGRAGAVVHDPTTAAEERRPDSGS